MQLPVGMALPPPPLDFFSGIHAASSDADVKVARTRTSVSS